MSIIRQRTHSRDFVIIHKAVLSDPELSWKAKGIWTYLMSLPDDWSINAEEVTSHSKDGYDSVLAGLNELVLKGYADRVQPRSKGKFSNGSWIIYELKKLVPYRENPSTEKQALLSTEVLSTKNTTTPTSSSKKKLEKPKSPDSKVVVSSLDKLKISEKRKLSLLKKHPIDEIDKAVGRVLKWTSRKNDEAAILTALREKDTWNDQVSIEDQIKENSKYLEQYRRLDNTKIGEYKVSVSYKYISFSYGRFYKEFSVVDKNFLEDLENFLHKISTHFTLSEWTKEI